ncbi:MAG: copper resistance protein CopC [Gordonia sp. (in: high G+C Gram-positive bacteria)]
MKALGSRRHWAVLLVLAAFVLTAGVFAGPASAHSRATGSTPADGAKVDRSPGTVSITFNEDLQETYAVLKVVGPDGHFWQQGDATVSGRTVSVPVNALGPVGVYKVNYRVTSADGHPVEGQRTFELTVAGNGQPGAAADDWQPKTDDGIKAWWFIVPAVVVVLAVAGAIAFVAVRRRS